MTGLDDLRFNVPGWEKVYEMLKGLSEKVVERCLDPDIVVGISMGGIIPAVVIADSIGVNVETLRVRFYEGVDDRGENPQIVQDIPVDINGKRVLLVDDVVDSGRTIRLVREHLHRKGAKEVTLCTIYYKPWSEIRPELYEEETGSWIIFPWERMETLRDISKRLSSEGLPEEEVRKDILSRGVPEDIIKEFYNLRWKSD
jgi:hypothetical protein